MATARTPTPENQALSDLREEVRRWRRDPVYFVEHVLGVTTLTPYGKEVLEALRDHPRVAVAACHDSGKTHSASCAAWWWALSFQPSKVITTAPTDRQVKQLLWSEIRSRHALARIALPGKVQVTHWQYPGQADWFMTGFATTPDSAQEHATRFQGYHSPSLLLVFDEAAGIDRAVWSAAEGLMTSGNCKHLIIGNPTDPTGEFARAYRSPDWYSIQIDALEMDHVRRGEEHPFLVSPRWVDQMRRRYGEDSPVFQAKVRGRFPDSAGDSLISIGWVQDAYRREADPALDAPRSMGVDVARFGSDLTCIYVLEGTRVLYVETKSGQDTMGTAGRVIRLASDYGVAPAKIAIDDTGVGGGVTDRLKEQSLAVKAENFGARATDAEVYYDRRSELWWAMRDWIRDEACLADAPAQARSMLMEDLTAPRYEQRSDGRLKLEAKRDMKRRLGRSPDHGDALALALAYRTQPVPAAVWVLEHDDEDDRRWGFGLNPRRKMTLEEYRYRQSRKSPWKRRGLV